MNVRENKKKRQHYVPKFYLKNFTRDDEKFSIVNVNTKEVIDSAHYKKQCYEDYYYGKNEVWEDKLADLEGKTASIINKLITSEYYPINEEIVILKQFILFQRVRTLMMKSDMRRVMNESTQLEVITHMKNENMKINVNTMNIVKNLVNEFIEDKQSEFPEIVLNVMEEIVNEVNIIDDLRLVIMEYENGNLISSDNPVILYNEFNSKGGGLAFAGLVILCPINDKKLLVFYDEKMYPKYANRSLVKINNKKEVEKLNALQLMSAINIVYFKNATQSNLILNSFNKYKTLLTQYKESKNSDTAINKLNKSMLVVFHSGYVPEKLGFSFCKVCSRGKGYNENEIDNFPRKYDIKYDNRLKNKVELFKHHINLSKKYTKINIKNLKRFNKFVYDYWNNRL